MDETEDVRLATLRAALSTTQAEVEQLRGQLIESLGDRMCGEGGGPTEEEVAAWQAMSLRHARQQNDLTRLIAEITRRYFQRMQRRLAPESDGSCGPKLPSAGPMS